jgi:ubiquinone biosynthesis protein
MLRPEKIAELFAGAPAAELGGALDAFTKTAPTADRVRAVERLLRAADQPWRDEVGEWIAELLNVEKLVPDAYRAWRPLVHDSMAFVTAHISPQRLAPKIVEQIEIAEDTAEESRLGIVIGKTPGLQKLGQVLARTRKLSPRLRAELQLLENGIKDTTPAEVRAIVEGKLGPCMRAYDVELAGELLSEASVSAIIEFTWFNPGAGRRERGVLKVMKPHVPAFYAEDLRLLQDLAEHLASRSRVYGFASREVVATLDEVRMLLESEVDFRREQATLAELGRVYRWDGAHAPRPIPELCADTVTAMSLERGVKVTDALRKNSFWRRRVAARIVESLVAAPIFSEYETAVFHADPHAGNILYDEGTNELVFLDWALTGRLSREDRRSAAFLIAGMSLRDADTVRRAIRALSRGAAPDKLEIIDRSVDQFFASLPFAASLGAMDAMELLDRIGVEGVRFPGELVLIRKVLFTLDGVLHDITGGEIRIDTIVTRDFVGRCLKRLGTLPPPFKPADYLALQKTALRYALGLWAPPRAASPAQPLPAALR